jgi:hypothetical protein
VRGHLYALLTPLAVIGMLIPGTAQAVTSAAPHNAEYLHISGQVSSGVKVVQAPATTLAPAASSTCKAGLWNGSNYGPPWGAQICGTELTIEYPTSPPVYEAFVIGTDDAIWHTWTGQSTWHSMGGKACASSACGVFFFDSTPTISVYGPQFKVLWCDRKGAHGVWGGWFTCPVTT